MVSKFLFSNQHKRASFRVAGALLAVILWGGCLSDDPGIIVPCPNPTIIRTSPASGETSVSLSKKTAAAKVAAGKVVTATFSRPMDAATINTATFKMRQGGSDVTGSVSYSDSTATFTVSGALGSNLAYTCTITTGAKDPAGIPLAHDYTWSFTTIAPGTPTLVSPANGSLNINIATNPILVWNSVPGAGSYRLQVSTNAAFSALVYDDSTRTDTTQSIPGLAFAATYYWRVNAKTSGATSPYSSVWHFTTLTVATPPVLTAPLPPLLVAPADASINISTNPTLIWNASTGADTYRVQVSTSPTFASLVLNDSTVMDTLRSLPGLTIGTTYYWRVNAKNTIGTSAFAGPRSFTTIPTPPLPPLLNLPADATINVSTTPTLSWNASLGSDTYHLQVSNNASFATTVFDDSTLTGNSAPVTGLTSGNVYFWRVSAKNSGGTSGYSTTWSFASL